MFSSRRYVTELTAWMMLYGLLLFASLTLIDRSIVTGTPLRAIVGLSPMIAGFGVLNLVMRQYRAADELQRKVVAESIMFAFGTTAIVTFSYGFLQRTAGAPDLSYFWVWAILGFSWLVGSAFAWRRYR